MRAMRVSNPAMRAIADQMERDEVLRWSNSLTRARVTRWGGMISTPDDVLQVSIDPGPTQTTFKKLCRLYITAILLYNSHDQVFHIVSIIIVENVLKLHVFKL
jgi:E3 ubiquitin-protein ligase NRDP1